MKNAHPPLSELLRDQRYRRQFFDADRNQARLMIVLASIAIYLTTRNDFVLLRGTWLLGFALGLKLLHFLATSASLLLLRRARWPREQDRAVALWNIGTAVVMLLMLPARLPSGETQGPTFGMAVLLVLLYFAQRGVLWHRIIAGFVVTCATLALLWQPLSTASSAGKVTGTVGMLALNAIGIFTARAFEEQRRKRFEAERQERRARRELAATNRELAEKKEQAEAMSRARTAFLAAMSHEFRTPMNAVLGLSGLLLDAPLESEHREYVRTIRESASALLTLLDDVLDFAKIDAGRLELSPSHFNLRALLGSVIEMMRPVAESRGLELSTNIPPALPAFVVGDDARLRQVLVNLLSNAIKFTERGAVRLHVTSRALAEPDHEIGFRVEDTGIGMSADVLGRLFQAFEQGSSGVARRYGGTGLGLVISRQIVRAMGADIHVESEPGRGSTFSFTLSLAETGPPAHLTKTVIPAARESRASLAILVVDDHPINRRVARAVLDRLGYRADFASDGPSAVEAVSKREYDAVFMDLQMPGMGGVEATKLIRAAHAGKSVPEIIAMTASVFEDDRAACRAAGMSGFLAKPIDIGKLGAILSRISGEGERDPLLPIEAEGAKLDRKLLDSLREVEALGEPGFVASVCREFLADTPLRILRMRTALIRGDLEELGRDAHSLKAASASLGAMEMSTLCGGIEAAASKGEAHDLGASLDALSLELSRVERSLRKEIGDAPPGQA